jgi:hypothetical protein
MGWVGRRAGKYYRISGIDGRSKVDSGTRLVMQVGSDEIWGEGVSGRMKNSGFVSLKNAEASCQGGGILS